MPRLMSLGFADTLGEDVCDWKIKPAPSYGDGTYPAWHFRLDGAVDIYVRHHHLVQLYEALRVALNEPVSIDQFMPVCDTIRDRVDAAIEQLKFARSLLPGSNSVQEV